VLGYGHHSPAGILIHIAEWIQRTYNHSVYPHLGAGGDVPQHYCNLIRIIQKISLTRANEYIYINLEPFSCKFNEAVGGGKASQTQGRAKLHSMGTRFLRIQCTL
jgi:hypothetical protein